MENKGARQEIYFSILANSNIHLNITMNLMLTLSTCRTAMDLTDPEIPSPMMISVCGSHAV